MPVSGPLLCEKDVSLSRVLNGELTSLLVKYGRGGFAKDMASVSCLYRERSC